MKSMINYALLFCYISCLAIATIELDQKHLSMYPYCGKLFGYEWHDATSRVVNSKNSETQYPWVVFVMRNYKVVSDKNGNTEETMEEKICGGTVIGDKYVRLNKKINNSS